MCFQICVMMMTRNSIRTIHCPPYPPNLPPAISFSRLKIFRIFSTTDTKVCRHRHIKSKNIWVFFRKINLWDTSRGLQQQLALNVGLFFGTYYKNHYQMSKLSKDNITRFKLFMNNTNWVNFIPLEITAIIKQAPGFCTHDNFRLRFLVFFFFFVIENAKTFFIRIQEKCKFPMSVYTGVNSK